jgi:hypothetical protein
MEEMEDSVVIESSSSCTQQEDEFVFFALFRDEEQSDGWSG